MCRERQGGGERRCVSKKEPGTHTGTCVEEDPGTKMKWIRGKERRKDEEKKARESMHHKTLIGVANTGQEGFVFWNHARPSFLPRPDPFSLCTSTKAVLKNGNFETWGDIPPFRSSREGICQGGKSSLSEREDIQQLGHRALRERKRDPAPFSGSRTFPLSPGDPFSLSLSSQVVKD